MEIAKMELDDKTLERIARLESFVERQSDSNRAVHTALTGISREIIASDKIRNPVSKGKYLLALLRRSFVALRDAMDDAEILLELKNPVIVSEINDDELDESGGDSDGSPERAERGESDSGTDSGILKKGNSGTKKLKAKSGGQTSGD